MSLNSLFKRRPFQIVLLLFNLAILVYCVHGFVGWTRQARLRALNKEFVAAADEMDKTPPGIHRAEVFLQRLKAIDTTGSPPAVKQALNDYISALQHGLDALKAGQDYQQYDAAIAAAQKALFRSVKESDD